MTVFVPVIVTFIHGWVTEQVNRAQTQPPPPTYRASVPKDNQGLWFSLNTGRDVDQHSVWSLNDSEHTAKFAAVLV